MTILIYNIQAKSSVQLLIPLLSNLGNQVTFVHSIGLVNLFPDAGESLQDFLLRVLSYGSLFIGYFAFEEKKLDKG
jgi:hypothetical protein